MLAAFDYDEEYEVLQARLKTLLPEKYRESYEDVQPVSMGSAGLKYGKDGRVAWDEIWKSYCDLAMAGGPPHRGTLLEPGAKAEIDLEPDGYERVVDELCRGVGMVTGLAAEPSLSPGWIDVDCPSSTMAGWLVRAINMENVSAHVSGMVLHLPAGPQFRPEKEIKNVVTSVAKTCHYWVEHTSVAQHRSIADLFEIMDAELPLIQAPFSASDMSDVGIEALRDRVAEDIQSSMGLEASHRRYYGWLGVDCLNVRVATFMMRMMAVSNVLCRREGNLIYIPVDPSTENYHDLIIGLVARSNRVAKAQGVV